MIFEKIVSLASETLRTFGTYWKLNDIKEAIKIDINAPLNTEKWSLLHIAVHEYNSPERYLFGFSFFESGSVYKKKLHPTNEHSSKIFELIQHLVEFGADVNVADIYSRTPIFFAKDKLIIDYLIAKGAKINPNTNTLSPLHMQSMLPKTNVSLLLGQGADPFKRDYFGRLPLHCAAKTIEQSVDNVRALIQSAPYACEIKDNMGFYPLSYACELPNQAIITLLLNSSSHFVIQEVITQISTGILDLRNASDDDPRDLFPADFDILESIRDPKNSTEPSIDEIKSENFNILNELDKNNDINVVLHTVDPVDDIIEGYGPPLPYDMYTIPYEFKLIKGGGKLKNHKKDKFLKQAEELVESKKKEEIYIVNGITYYLHADDHASKHLAPDEALMPKEIKQRTKEDPAIFNSYYRDNYLEKLREVIIFFAQTESEVIDVTKDRSSFIKMSEHVGWDEKNKTDIVELYYGGIIGSHMRPKFIYNEASCDIISYTKPQTRKAAELAFNSEVTDEQLLSKVNEITINILKSYLFNMLKQTENHGDLTSFIDFTNTLKDNGLVDIWPKIKDEVSTKIKKTYPLTKESRLAPFIKKGYNTKLDWLDEYIRSILIDHTTEILTNSEAQDEQNNISCTL